ncbi:MAG: fumarylacetoacetate hydrolase family protein [Bacteroidota bacterium]|jgi:2-keto-4-pentenoate hydratase/2-oxohepta-3-ene-1,7-dioic acid hydratase in catechol pathway|nr:fumarylacetoacetate hydrolase family protein [Bacteroidales bacterium]MDI9534733.1 fumarylacetoacetate hydrolase family protein [Bacteroidota bacterium]OQC46825.1 MAG: Ureidoglycolate lyase [Bacteroidetes bacterium ADurb.Bin028]NLP19960.1 fumarylacetoacetate hydrolase family protein [Bacteroidales bacterium]HNY43320.1 fumarylacetoacetate hydrolase family protein [Bacteroidales bacterium]
MKIICIGHNYKDHIEEMNAVLPEKPVFFLKPDSSILQTGKDFYLPDFSNDIQYELEIIVKIHRLGKHIDKKFAHRYYSHIGVGIDVTARDLQRDCKEKGLPWEIAKAFDGSAMLSEWIPIEEIEDVNNINFKLMRNGELVQLGNTKNMVFNIDEIIEYVSKFLTLKIGDIIFTGTPKGVGKLEIGDELKAFIEEKELLNIKIK